MSIAINKRAEKILVEWYENKVKNKSRKETGKKYALFSLLKKSAIDVVSKKTEAFDCTTNLEEKSVHGLTATKNAEIAPIVSFFETPYAKKYTETIVKIPKIA